ncbi:hypothetical protein MPLSOD_200020 [Mesorhizobium sp. SOD10]|nr:hypothetical protein MPLSOD_200020 [Mesorhizobium sp. SOD10]
MAKHGPAMNSSAEFPVEFLAIQQLLNSGVASVPRNPVGGDIAQGKMRSAGKYDDFQLLDERQTLEIRAIR